MNEEEVECHFCKYCGADDTLVPFYKDSDGSYICPDCEFSPPAIKAEDLLPCRCGSLPIVDKERRCIYCPNGDLSIHCSDFSELFKSWNDQIMFWRKVFGKEIF